MESVLDAAVGKIRTTRTKMATVKVTVIVIVETRKTSSSVMDMGAAVNITSAAPILPSLRYPRENFTAPIAIHLGRPRVSKNTLIQ
jgi:hypothetical protein